MLDWGYSCKFILEGCVRYMKGEAKIGNSLCSVIMIHLFMTYACQYSSRFAYLVF